MDGLRDPEERLVSADELPVGRDPEVSEQRDLRPQDLGDPAAVRCRAHVQHAASTERCGQFSKARDGFTAGTRLVAVDGLRAHVDALEHRGPSALETGENTLTQEHNQRPLVKVAVMTGPGLQNVSEQECLALLRSAGLGRIALRIGDSPAILPVNFAMLDDDVVFRTDPGSKLSAALMGIQVAFEVDHAEGPGRAGWSVLVVGYAEEIRDSETLERVSRLELEPWVGGRHRLRRPHSVARITGRRIVPPVECIMTGTSEWGDPGDTGRRVAHRRRELGLSVADVAERAGMDPSYLEYVESQPAQLTNSALVRLATVLETTPAALSGGGIDRPPGESGRARRQSRLDTLTPEECRELLGHGGVGRIVFHNVRGPVALPVNYRMWNDDVVFRTAALSSLRGARYAQRLSFEVDHIDGAMRQGWSVLVRGYAHEVRDAEELQARRTARGRALGRGGPTCVYPHRDPAMSPAGASARTDRGATDVASCVALPGS